MLDVFRYIISKTAVSFNFEAKQQILFFALYQFPKCLFNVISWSDWLIFIWPMLWLVARRFTDQRLDRLLHWSSQSVGLHTHGCLLSCSSVSQSLATSTTLLLASFRSCMVQVVVQLRRWRMSFDGVVRHSYCAYTTAGRQTSHVNCMKNTTVCSCAVRHQMHKLLKALHSEVSCTIV